MTRYALKSYNAGTPYQLYIYKLTSLLCAGLAVVTACALATFNALDNSWLYFTLSSSHVGNSMGVFGAQYAATLRYLFGWGACGVPAILAFLSYCLFFNTYEDEYDRLWLSPITLMTISFVARLHTTVRTLYGGGGIIGEAIHLHIAPWCDPKTLLLLSYVVLIAQGIVLARTSLFKVLTRCSQIVYFMICYRQFWLTPIIRLVTICFTYLYQAATWLGRHSYRLVLRLLNIEYPTDINGAEIDQTLEEDLEMLQEDLFEDQEELVEQEEHATQAPRRRNTYRKYRLPQENLFSASDRQQQNHVTSEHTHLAQVLEEKLARFNVTGKVTKIKPGPVITLFEYQPDIDSKVSKILALEHDLALALEAVSVRIVAPIPGTSRVGFEVANKERKSVKMGDIVRSAVFAQTRFSLPLILGQDTAGENIVVDLIDMPHLLVAGSTGSGKSVALNVMLTSLLCKLSPEALRLIIIDPKRLEFSAYQDIAHLLFPIITDARRAAPVTQWLVKTMEDRYEFMAKQGVRNILDYKRTCQKEGATDELPFIVFIIDELADLMMVAGKDIETNIARLAQMARAAGIHLIIATQRPSVDVITGVIKVNFPSRISFRVSSKIDSRTIIDTGGAEVLLGKGDMLFMDAGSARIRRVHGAYISDSEIATIVDHIHQQATVEYIDLQEAIAAYEHGQQAQDYDDLLPEVIRFIDQLDEVSISLLQRKFKIGYNRSAAIIEQLECQGKILPAQGGKMRKVIK